MVPYDVLIDPMSLPSHPVVAEKQNMHQIIHEDMAKTETEGVGLSVLLNLLSSFIAGSYKITVLHLSIISKILKPNNLRFMLMIIMVIYFV